MSKFNKHGFTLIELLVVIAIIGILSQIAVVNLSSTKITAKKVATMEKLSRLAPAIQLCLYGGKDLYCGNPLLVGSPECGATEDIPPAVGGFEICDGSDADWPDLARDGWEYYEQVSYDDQGMTWSIAAIQTASAGETWRVDCSSNGCVDSRFDISGGGGPPQPPSQFMP